MSNKKKTLIIGASENPERYANKAFHSLTKHGHPVVMLANKEGKIDEVIIPLDMRQFMGNDCFQLYWRQVKNQPCGQ